MNARDPELEFPVYTRDGGDAVLEVKDDDGLVHRRLEIKLDPGINTITWDLLVDSAVILEIEQAKLQKPKKPKPDEDEDKDKDESESEEDEPSSTEGTRGKMPVQEGIRLGWKPYCQPGDYDLVLTVGEASHSRSWTMKKPSSRSKGKKKKDKIRGR